MTKFLVVYLILGLLSTGCVSENATGLENHKTSKTIEPEEKEPSDEAKLSKEIFILIGRGGCCKGHIISINTIGEIKYFVGIYSIPSDKWEMPEIYDSQKITATSTYKPKDLKLSQEKIKKLEQLINSEEKLQYKEDISVDDDYLYSVYLGNKKIASGYQSRKDKFPENLKALIDFAHKEVDMYELPGMA